MRIAKSIGLIVVGIAIGVASMSFGGTSAAAARRSAQQRTTAVLSISQFPQLAFVTDPNSGGCWLARAVNVGAMPQPEFEATALVPAPSSACSR